MKWVPPAACLLLLAACGTGSGLPDPGELLPTEAQEVMAAPDTFEIYALHPSPWEEDGKPRSPEEALDDYRILGRATVDDPAERREITRLVYQGIVDSDGRVAACFNPRHGIRAIQGDREVAFVICYECLSMQVHGPADGQVTNALTADGVEPALTRIWQAHGLTLHR